MSRPAPLLVGAFILLIGTAAPSWAQSEGRLAIGLDVSAKMAADDGTIGHSAVGLLWRIGHGRDGWGWRYGLSWYATDLLQPIGDVAPTAFGTLKVRPVLAGYGYERRFGRVDATARVLGGYAFNSFTLLPTFDDAYRRRLGATTVTTDVSNGFVVKPELSVWVDLSRKLGLQARAGYMVSRPGVTVSSSLGRDRRRINADVLMLRVGVVYSVF